MRTQRITQTATFVLFALLLWLSRYPLDAWVPVNLFVRMDPLVSAGTMLAARAWIPELVWGLVIVALGVVLGRFFCGYVCPMGTTVDLAERLLGRSKVRRGRNAAEAGVRIRGLKFLLLLATLITVLLGTSLVFLVSPLSMITRFYAVSIYPGITDLADWGLRTLDPVLPAVGLERLRYVQIDPVRFGANLFTACLVLGILLLGYVRPRFWCRNLCPAGAIMALFARKPLVRRAVDSRCTECGACIQACPMGAISENPFLTSHDECIVCQTCREICPQDAVSFTWSTRGAPGPAVDIGRRRWLLAGGAGLLTGLLLRTNLMASPGSEPDRALRSVPVIRPPGALPENAFLNLCTRCGECMKVCATNTLQPLWFEAGLQGMWTPALVPRWAACEQACNLCGQVCPTGAVRPLSLQDKIYAKIGTAYVDRFRCIAWEQDRKCLICDEICPYNAIVMRPVPGLENSVPFVDEARCNGCGYCENRCPVVGRAAILVSPMGQVRLASGSYTEHARRLGLVFQAQGGIQEQYEGASGVDADGAFRKTP